MRGARWRRSVIAAATLLMATTLAGCGGERAVTLTANPGTATYDTPLSIDASGLDPHSDATLQVTTIDAKGATWSAQAVFRTDGSGRVSTAQAPVSGDYGGADPMGLVEVLSPGHLGAVFDPPSNWTMTVAVLVDGKERARTEVVRQGPRQLGLHTTDLRPETSGVYGTLFLPATTPSTPASAVVVMGGSEGGLSTSLQAATLAEHGHPALALAYFAEPGLPAELEDIPLEYFATAATILSRQPGVDPAKVVLWGISRGSEAALLTAALRPDLVHGVIAAVPGAESYRSLPDPTVAAWTSGGTPLPIGTTAEFESPSATAPATIPVEKIDGPLLLVCGNGDRVWSSCLNITVIRQRLTTAGVTRTPTVLQYADAGHFVGGLIPYVPTTSTSGVTAAGDTLQAGGTYESDASARAAAWPATLAWLTKL